MVIGLTMLICSMIYLLLTSINYFARQRLNNKEIKIYSWLIYTSFVGIILEIGCILIVPYCEEYVLINEIINRLFLLYILMWVSLFTVYIFTISFDNNGKIAIFVNKQIKIIKFIAVLIFLLFAFLILYLPLYYYYDGNYVYSYGAATSFLYFVNVFLITIWLLCLFLNIKKVGYKKYIPLFSFIFCALIILIVREINPGILLITVTQTFITIMMYYTIENPDVKMIESLNIAKDTAEKANRAKSDFLSSMSHEIRTPLNAIVGFSDCIINADSLEEAKDNAKDVITASNTLLEIVNGILDISKIEAGKLELVESDYDIKKLLDEVIKLIRVRIGDKPLEFKVNIAEDLPQVLYGDHINVKKIFINLLTNAVKYTDQGVISLDVKCVKKNQICRLIISVKDTGRGIKKEDIAKLFTKFQRVDEDRNTTIEGTGLGLAITKQLVNMMNGNIVVNSVYGEGSEFTVAIDQRLSLAKIEEEKEVTTDFNLDLTGKKILIVDDNALNIKVAEKILIKYNPTIDSCESGLECLEKVKLNNYDLILLDDMMPKMKGSEVLIKLKENPNFNTPVIVLTANAINGMEEQYLSKGFNGYLAKPIEKDKLFYILNKYLGNSKSMQNPETKVVENQMTDYSNKKVLVVDDNKVNITITCNFLKPYKFNIDFCESGKECLEKSNNNYDLIFMDIMMPEMDGVQTLHKLKENPNFNTVVIALTADAVEGAEQKYLNEGFDDYIAKPLIKEKLDNKIKRNINKNNINYLKEKGININSSLELLGDIKTYNEILKEYVNGINEKITNLTNFKNNNDMENYAILVHSLKSESRYLGFDKLADICLQHELKSKENDATYVNNNFNVLLTELNNILEIVKQYLN